MRKFLVVTLAIFIFQSAFSQKTYSEISIEIDRFLDTPIKRPAYIKLNKSVTTDLLEHLSLNKKLEFDSKLYRNCIPDTATIRRLLIRLPYFKNSSTGNKIKRDAIMSQYAFRKLLKKDFNKLILGNNEVSKLKKYASLDISQKPEFAFSPLILESDPKAELYRNIFSLNISGKLNPENFYNLSKLRDLTFGFSFNHILNWTNYRLTERAETIRDKYNCTFINKINSLAESSWEEFDILCNNLNCLSDHQKKEKSGELRKKLFNDYTDLEIEMLKEYWSTKNFWWYTLEGEFIIDKPKYIAVKDTIGGKFEPNEAEIFSPSLLGSINFFTQHAKKENSFFASLWGSVRQKHSLSEIIEPKSFQSFKKINESLNLVDDNEDIFITDFDELDKKFVFDFGIRLVGLVKIIKITHNNKRQFGLTFSFIRKGLVNKNELASLFRTEGGIIFPFRNADGETTFNMEIFRRWDRFSNFKADNEELWGARFNVPIN